MIVIAAETEMLARQVGRRRLAPGDLPFSVGRRPHRAERAPRTALSLVLADLRPYNLSREHFTIALSAAGLIVHDPGSQLGTLVNGVRIGTGHASSVAPLRAGANAVVAGADDSPFRFIVTVAAA